MSNRKNTGNLESDNAKILAELAVDSETSIDLQVKIIQKLLDNTQHKNFFDTVFNDKLSAGNCPGCGHFNHWLIPENNLNEMGWITHLKDKAVVARPKTKDCAKFAEACHKKKVNI